MIVNTKEPKTSIWHKNCFNGIKDNFIDNSIAKVKQRFPEKDVQVLKDFNPILNPAKLHSIAAGI